MAMGHKKNARNLTNLSDGFPTGFRHVVRQTFSFLRAPFYSSRRVSDGFPTGVIYHDLVKMCDHGFTFPVTHLDLGETQFSHAHRKVLSGLRILQRF